MLSERFFYYINYYEWKSFNLLKNVVKTFKSDLISDFIIEINFYYFIL